MEGVNSVVQSVSNDDSRSALLEQFLGDCRLRDMTAETIRCYRSNVRIYLNYLKGEQKDALTVDKKILLGFLKYLREERCVSHKRVENYFSSVSSFYEFLCYEDYVGVI